MTVKLIRWLEIGLMLVLSVFCFQTLAQPVPMSGTRWRGMETEEDYQPKKEWEVVFPAFPKEEDMLSFYVSPIQTQKFYVDSKSLAINDKETEVRYTLIGISSGGAKNITYEGIKCDGGMMRRYAIGHDDGTWSPSRQSAWKDIQFRNANRPQAELALSYFCQGRGVATLKVDELIWRLRNKQSLQGSKYDNVY